MRRSKSSSNIPMPVFGRTLSSENLRKSQTVLKRTNSSNNLIPPRVSARSSLKPPNENYRSSQTGSVSKAGLSKRATATPMRMGSMTARIASPSAQLTTQKINDKKYVADQYKKVSSFLEQRMENFEPKFLKSLTLTSFVSILTLLFNEIDPRININMENHKEIAMKYLKLYKYPGPVSVSMLRSANTPLSWNPIMSIFGWLVDIINKCNDDDFEEDDLKKYVVFQFNKYFRSGTEEMPENYIDKITSFDAKEFTVLKAELNELRKQKEAMQKSSSMCKKKEEDLNKKFNEMTSEIKEFKEGKLETKIKNEIKQLTSDTVMKEKQMADMRLALNKIKETVANQEYGVNEKASLLKELENKEYSMNLKKKELENVMKLKYEYDTKQTDYRREIETEIHKINGRLLQLNLVVLDADIKKIQLPDRWFHQSEFLQVVEEKKQLLQNIEEKADTKMKLAKESLAAVKSDLEIINENLEKFCKENTILRSKVGDLNLEKERISFETNVIIQKLEKKIASMKVSDLKALEKEKMELRDEILKIEKIEKVVKEYWLEKFQVIHESAAESGKEMYEIMKEIYECAMNTHAELVTKIIDSQLQDLNSINFNADQ